MTATLTQPMRRSDSERERLRRRRDRHARLATDAALTEAAFTLLARERQARGATAPQRAGDEQYRQVDACHHLGGGGAQAERGRVGGQADAADCSAPAKRYSSRQASGCSLQIAQ
jgi:hypothetical protein